MSWTVRTLESLNRDVTGLPDRVKQEALDWIDELAHDPFPDGCLKMRGYNNRYRIPFGGNAYRIVYTVDTRKRLVTIYRARPRSSVYAGMKKPRD